jgi:hypothetical protein
MLLALLNVRWIDTVLMVLMTMMTITLLLSVLFVAYKFAKPLRDESAIVDLGTFKKPLEQNNAGRTSGVPPQTIDPNTGSYRAAPESLITRADLIARLEQLAKLRAAGAITADEEASARKSILDKT